MSKNNAVLSINANDSMNRVLRTVFCNDFYFYSVSDVYSGFRLLKQYNEIGSVIIDIEENCKDCIEFVAFIHSSKIYNKEVLVLCSRNQSEQMDFLTNSFNARVYIKPFDPKSVLNELKKSLSLDITESQN